MKSGTKRQRENSVPGPVEVKSKKRLVKLTEYVAHPLVYYQRKDCEEGLQSWMPHVLKSVPNAHSKLPDVKARTPNVAIDNLCLFKNDKGELCTILGLFDKKFQDKPLKGFVMSGGHMEYHEDVDLKQCALRELQEEFGIVSEDIVKSVPVAIFDDAFRDIRNRYVSMVFLHWVNSAPVPSDEHKVIVILPVSKLKDVLSTGGKIFLDDTDKEGYGFLHGHDSILNTLLQDRMVLTLIEEIMSSA